MKPLKDTDLAPLPESRTRALLRKVRDRDLRSERVELDGGRVYTFDGCASLDQPVEALVRYRMRTPEGQVEAFELHMSDGDLLLQRRSLGGPLLSETRVRIHGTDTGCAIAPDILARIDPEQAAERDIAHFLRRLVRACFRAA